MFDTAPHRTIVIRQRNKLQHWTTDEGTYFVTMRLFDSIPHGAAVELPRLPQSAGYARSAGAGDAVVEWEGPDAMRIVTRGSSAGMLFVARSFTRTVSSTVNGRSVAVYPANVNVIALPVPAGESRVALRLAE